MIQMEDDVVFTIHCKIFPMAAGGFTFHVLAYFGHFDLFDLRHLVHVALLWDAASAAGRDGRGCETHQAVRRVDALRQTIALQAR